MNNLFRNLTLKPSPSEQLPNASSAAAARPDVQPRGPPGRAQGGADQRDRSPQVLAQRGPHREARGRGPGRLRRPRRGHRGIVLGLAAALASARGLASLLYEVTPGDPLTYVVITLLLGAVTLLAE